MFRLHKVALASHRLVPVLEIVLLVSLFESGLECDGGRVGLVGGVSSPGRGGGGPGGNAGLGGVMPPEPDILTGSKKLAPRVRHFPALSSSWRRPIGLARSRNSLRCALHTYRTLSLVHRSYLLYSLPPLMASTEFFIWWLLLASRPGSLRR